MTHTTDERSPAGTARDEAKSVGEEIREKGAEAARTARDTARGYAEQARDEAYARGEAYRDYAAEETSKVAAALRRASQDLHSGSPQERFIGQIADGVADAAERVRGMSLDEIGRDTTEFARRHPAAFLGGAALIGFAAARFLKASAHHEEETLYLSHPAGAQTGPAPSSEPIPSPSTRSVGTTSGAGSTPGGPGAAGSNVGTSPSRPSPADGSSPSSPASGASSVSATPGASTRPGDQHRS